MNAKSPTLLLISGPPGIGKSTLAKELASHHSATHLDKDAVDEPFSPDDRGKLYSKNIEPKVLAALLNLAELNLRPNHHVILDVPWTHIFLNSPEWAGRIQQLVKRSKARLVIIECVLSERLLKERIRKRGLKRDQIKLTRAGWKAFGRTDCLGARNPLPHHVLEMSQSPRACLKNALRLSLKRDK